MSDQPAPVQTLVLRTDVPQARGPQLQEPHTLAFFAVVTADEMQCVLATPELYLNQAELAAWQTLRLENKRQSALQGRIAAKRALGAALGEVDATKIGIARGSFGQPLVRHPRAAGIDITLSHSHGLAVALAYPDALPMGIDLEQVPAVSAHTVLGELQMSDAERAWLAQAPIGAATACGMLWSAREALGKSLKTGINSPLGVFALSALEPMHDADGVPPGTVAWIGHYANFPHTHCLVQVSGSRVLTLALPRVATLARWPQMPHAAS
jgi:4'-phosphopantetheinyl transferase